MNKFMAWSVVFFVVLAGSVGTVRGQGDAEVVAKIIDEGVNRSQVWAHLEYLSETIGPRLTGSSRLMEANAWTRDVLRSYGLTNAHLMKWGEIPVRFDRGPSTAKMVSPVEREFEFTTRSWSAGTEGAVRGAVIKMPGSLGDVEAMGEDLKGAWVLSKPQPRRFRRGRRNESDEDKAKREAAAKEREQIRERLREAGIAGYLYASRGDLVITSSIRGWRDLAFDDLPSEVEVFVRRIDYDAMNSRISDGEEVEVEIDLQHHFVEGPFGTYNTIAEIPGTELPNEVVILSGHLDSWDGPGTTATQDNGNGSSVVLEAARILTTVGVQPKRTIRFILWTGEEQGLLGSRGYVDSLSDEEKAGISAVFVEDGGTNYEGGLQCIESMAEMLGEATAAVSEAFPEMPVEIHVRKRMPRGGGSDHASFNREGIPGFFWDEVGIGGREGKDYRFIHHTQHDIMRYAVPEYVVQSAVCSAVTIYNLAMADTMLPRQQPREEVAKVEEPVDTRPFKVVTGAASGEWTVVFADDDATISLEMSEDGRIRGRLVSAIGEGKLSRCSFNPMTGKIKFSFNAEAMEALIEFEAKIVGDEMTGTLGVEDYFEREFTATRKQPIQEESGADSVAKSD